MRGIGCDLLKQSKVSHEEDKRNTSSGREDILSLFVQANAMQDLPEARWMIDEDVPDQIPTFFIAGLETTRRQEVSDVSIDNATMNVLPYLRETLHPYLPVSSTV
ncbi:hypothetical protein BYT27DRAFT_7194522 [Phlegmacium glaucopus]|nr:hypothetical protein BYT27DRAFT_7194522 [Phlegmacium glaucopus]